MFGGLLSRKTEKYKNKNDIEHMPRDRAFSETDNNEIKIVGPRAPAAALTTKN